MTQQSTPASKPASEPASERASERASEPAPEEHRSSFRPKAPYLLISFVVLLLDQWSKWMVEEHLDLHAGFEVFPGFLDFTHVRNTGVAFGLFASHGDTTGTLVLLGLGLLALTFVGYYFWIVPKEDKILLWALSLVVGGAVGNLLDRLVQGGVTDFVDFYVGDWHWHTFNVADSAISVGIGLMILGAFLGHPSPDAADGPEDPAAEDEARENENADRSDGDR